MQVRLLFTADLMTKNDRHHLAMMIIPAPERFLFLGGARRARGRVDQWIFRGIDSLNIR